MRLIDADKYIEDCKEVIADGWNQMSGPSSWARAYEDVIDEINEQPTIDAVPVVRCKDCKHSQHWYGDKHLCYLWSETGIDVFEDGYCSYGERYKNE